MAHKLPTELIEACFASVDPNDKATCAAVCASSKLGRRAATPVLYSSVGIVDRHLKADVRAHKLHLLCRTLSENPELATHATIVRQYLDYDTMRPLKDTAGHLSTENLEELICTQQKIPHAIFEAFTWDIEAEGIDLREEVYVMLMLLLCRNLESIEFSGDLGNILDCIVEFFKEIDDIDDDDDVYDPEGVEDLYKTGFFTVHNISLKPSDGTQVSVEDLFALLQFPNLQGFSTTALHHFLDRAMGEPPDFRYCLHKLSIENCYASVDDLSQILPGLIALESLSIEWAHQSGYHRRLDWPDLGSQLIEYCPDLRSLRLDYGDDCRLDDSNMDGATMIHGEDIAQARIPGIGKLSGLSKLTHLAVGKNALLGTRGTWSRFGPRDRDARQDVANGIGSPDDGKGPALPSLGDALPDSLMDLTIICESDHIRSEAEQLLSDPRTANLDDLTVINCDKTHWFSKKGGEGGMEPRKRKRATSSSSSDNKARRYCIKEVFDDKVDREEARYEAIRKKSGLPDIIDDVCNTAMDKLKAQHIEQGLPPPNYLERRKLMEEVIGEIQDVLDEKRSEDGLEAA